MNKNIEIDIIIERALVAFGCKKQEQLADMLNISASDFSARKRRGTLTKLIEKKAYKNNISYDWIKTGQGEMMAGSGTGTPISEPQTAYHGHPPSSYEHPLIKKTRTVLESDSVYRRALDSNIEAFHEAVRTRDELQCCRVEISQLQQAVNMLREEVAELKTREPKKKVV